MRNELYILYIVMLCGCHAALRDNPASKPIEPKRVTISVQRDLENGRFVGVFEDECFNEKGVLRHGTQRFLIVPEHDEILQAGNLFSLRYIDAYLTPDEEPRAAEVFCEDDFSEYYACVAGRMDFNFRSRLAIREAGENAFQAKIAGSLTNHDITVRLWSDRRLLVYRFVEPPDSNWAWEKIEETRDKATIAANSPPANSMHLSIVTQRAVGDLGSIVLIEGRYPDARRKPTHFRRFVFVNKYADMFDDKGRLPEVFDGQGQVLDVYYPTPEEILVAVLCDPRWQEYIVTMQKPHDEKSAVTQSLLKLPANPTHIPERLKASISGTIKEGNLTITLIGSNFTASFRFNAQIGRWVN